MDKAQVIDSMLRFSNWVLGERSNIEEERRRNAGRPNAGEYAYGRARELAKQSAERMQQYAENLAQIEQARP
jgi:hypothetical protein